MKKLCFPFLVLLLPRLAFGQCGTLNAGVTFNSGLELEICSEKSAHVHGDIVVSAIGGGPPGLFNAATDSVEPGQFVGGQFVCNLAGGADSCAGCDNVTDYYICADNTGNGKFRKCVEGVLSNFSDLEDPVFTQSTELTPAVTETLITTGEDPTVYTINKRNTTVGAASTSFTLFDSINNRGFLIEARTMAICGSGSTGCTVGQVGGWFRRALFKDIAGAVTEVDEGASSEYGADDITGTIVAPTFSAVGTSGVLTVTGLANQNLTWHVRVVIQVIGQ